MYCCLKPYKQSWAISLLNLKESYTLTTDQRLFFHFKRCTLLSIAAPSELRCTLMRYAAPHWAMLQSIELRSSLLNYAAPFWDALHSTEMHCILLRCTAFYWAALHSTELRNTLLTLHPTELRRTLLSCNAPYWAAMHPTELQCTLLCCAASQWVTLQPTELRCKQLSFAATFWRFGSVPKCHGSTTLLHNFARPFWVGTNDFDAKMSVIKFWKGNENLRPLYKKTVLWNLEWLLAFWTSQFIESTYWLF